MTHYQALELPNTATAANIRQAYRRLVLLTHPDCTAEPAAHARYLVVNAAYEVLGDPDRRAAYDDSFRTPAVPLPMSAGRARDAAHRAAWAGRPRPATVPLTVRYAAEYALSLRITKPLMLFALLLTASILLDYASATEHHEKVLRVEPVIYYTGSRASRHSEVYFRHYTDDGRFDAEAATAAGTPLLIRRTPLWRSAVAVHEPLRQKNLGFRSLYSLPKLVMLLIMAAAAAFSLRPAFNADQRLTVALLATVLLGIVAYWLLG